MSLHENISSLQKGFLLFLLLLVVLSDISPAFIAMPGTSGYLLNI